MLFYCPFCPYKAKEGRTDHLRSHVNHKHPIAKGPVSLLYEDEEGKMEKLTETLYIKKDKKDAYAHGFCLSCASWVKLTGLSQAVRPAMVRQHRCKPVQKRSRIVGERIVRGHETMTSSEIFNLFKRHGFEDQVELTVSSNIDLPRTLNNIRAEQKKPVIDPDSMLEKAKKDKALVALKLEEMEKRMRDMAESNNADLEEGEELEVFDEWNDIFRPLLVELTKTVPQREKLSNTIKDLRVDLDKCEEKYELMVSEKDAKIRDLKERLIEACRANRGVTPPPGDRSPQLTDDPDTEEEEPDDEEPDTIEHVAENNWQLWSLPYRG